MSEITEESTQILDSAIGPVQIKSTRHKNFDVDDFVTLSVEGQANNMILKSAADAVDPEAARNRPKVQLDGTEVGGYNG